MPAVTVRELRAALLNVTGDDLERVVHVVYHGYERPSFNLPVSTCRSGANVDDFLVIVEEPR